MSITMPPQDRSCPAAPEKDDAAPKMHGQQHSALEEKPVILSVLKLKIDERHFICRLQQNNQYHHDPVEHHMIPYSSPGQPNAI